MRLPREPLGKFGLTIRLGVASSINLFDSLGLENRIKCKFIAHKGPNAPDFNLTLRIGGAFTYCANENR